MKRFLVFAVAAVLFAACSKDALDEQQGIQNIVDEAPATLTVGFEDDETRIQLNSAQKTVWTKDDLVSVFYLSDANQQWQYTGETGARTAKLTRVNAGNATTTTTGVVVVYPYNENYYLNTRTLNVKATLPATQTYLEDSYGLDGNIMISQSEYNNISLKNVCGWLKLQLTGNGEQIKSITVRGNNGEQVAGELYINSADATATLASDMGDVTEDEGENVAGGAGGNLVFEDTVLKEVTLNCVDGTSPTEKGVEVANTATAFYIALPPQTFTKGITVEITDTTNFTMTQSTDKEVVIERNHIQPMAAFKFVNPNTPTLPTPTNNEIWYTATKKVEPYYTDEFGATYLSNVWDSETGKGVITFEGDVTKIGYYAFYECDSLTSVTIPDSVTTIGERAFYWCESLTSVTIGDSVTTIGEGAFNWCASLTSVTIPDSVTTIGGGVFQACTSLTSVTIGDSVTTIGDSAFAGCNSLTSVTIPDSVTTIGDWAFNWCESLTSVTIGDSVTTIGEGAFNWCASLTSVTIPDSVTTIGGGVFQACTSLTSVTIGDSVTTIGEGAFAGCESLTSVTIGNSVTTIGHSAFYGCSSLKEFKGKFAADNGRCLIMDNTIIAYANASGTTYTIPDSVTTIGDYAFYECYSLISVTIPDSVTTIGYWAFQGCASLTSVTIGNSVTTIGDLAFEYCDSLKEFKGKFAADGGRCLIMDNTIIAYANASGTTYTIPDSVTTIGDWAFYWCESLTSVTIPDSVTTIGYWAFQGCASLTSVTIGNSVTTIGDLAFYDCTSLKTVYCKPTTPPAGGYDMFYGNVAGCRIFVPASDDDSIIDAYKEAYGWSNYADYIFEEE